MKRIGTRMIKNEDNTIAAIIPARGGSKRLPGKNTLEFAGKPLIAWTIDAALKSKYVDEVIVSTDDRNIAEIARNFGAQVPFLRDPMLAGDEITAVDVVIDVVEKLNLKAKYIALLQPTSPLRTFVHIDEAIELLAKRDAVISVVRADHPIEWYGALPSNRYMDNFFKTSKIKMRSQDLPERFRLNGAIYLIKTDLFLREKTFHIRDGAIAYVMDATTSVDIDYKQDLAVAIVNYIGVEHVIDMFNH